jgi:hypothetical protein
MAHGRYRYSVENADGQREGTCHVLFAEGEIALLDPDTDFSAVEPAASVGGVVFDRPTFGKRSLRFSLGEVTVSLRDTASSDAVGRQITTALGNMFPGASPLRSLHHFETQVRIAQDEWDTKNERAEYAGRGEVAPRDLRSLAGGTAPVRSGPITYLSDGHVGSETVFDGIAVATKETCSFGFIRPSGEVVRWHWFDFGDVRLIGWHMEPEEPVAILVEIAARKKPLKSSSRLSAKQAAAVKAITGDTENSRCLVRFHDGPEGIIDYIIDQSWARSRFPLDGHTGDGKDVKGLKLLPGARGGAIG